MSAAGGDDNWPRYLKKGNPHKYCHHNHMQCQICKKHQQQCHTCSNYLGGGVGGADNNLAILHVSSTPNLGGGYKMNDRLHHYDVLGYTTYSYFLFFSFPIL